MSNKRKIRGRPSTPSGPVRLIMEVKHDDGCSSLRTQRLADVATMAAVDVATVPHGGSLSAACVPPSSTVVVPPAPRPTMHDALQTYYRCFDVGNFDKASTVVRDYPQLADLYEKAQAAQQVTP